MLEVALRQSGTEAARRSLERAAAAAAASKDGSGIGIIEVRPFSLIPTIKPFDGSAGAAVLLSFWDRCKCGRRRATQHPQQRRQST